MKKNRIAAIVWIIFILFFYFIEGGYTANLLLLFTLLLTVFSVLSLYVFKPKVSLGVELSSDAAKGEEVTALIETTVGSFFSAGFAQLHINFTNVISSESHEIETLIAFSANRSNKTFFNFSDNYAGEIILQVHFVRCLDIFKVFSRKVQIHERDTTIIRPDMIPLEMDKDALYSYDMESYIYSSDKKGTDTSETFGIREYSGGDSLKTIHWKLTSKLDKMMVKEPGLPVDNKAILILNNRNGAEELSSKERDELVENFFGIAIDIARQGLDFSIGWYNSELEEFICEPIEWSDNIYEAMKGVLSAPFYDDEISVIDRMMMENIHRRFASYIYVTAYGEEVGGLERYGAVKIQGGK